MCYCEGNVKILALCVLVGTKRDVVRFVMSFIPVSFGDSIRGRHDLL